ncbi:MAG: hypothetical protein RMX35_30545 [Nostoc sp. DcaGUA01]|nr:hypothetical protein [Nostoc sp. DcaGUA01]
MRKFVAEGFDFSNDNTKIIINFNNELSFIDNLQYWQISINSYDSNVILLCLDSNEQINYFNLLILPISIFDFYIKTSPECFYEVAGLLNCLFSIHKKYFYIQNHKEHSLISSDSFLPPEALLKALVSAHKGLEKWQERHKSTV